MTASVFDSARATKIFRGVERTLIAAAERSLSADAVRQQLGKFRHAGLKEASDNEFYWALVKVVFYSGFRASTVTAKLSVIHDAFPDFRTVSGYTDDKVAAILANPEMIRNRNKITACVRNAQVFCKLIASCGSIQSWIRSRVADESVTALLDFREELQQRLSGIGPITAFHFMTDVGLPVLKPDRVICRLFFRLGFIEAESDTLGAIRVGRDLAIATGEPIRYIDIVFVAYGQAQTDELGLHKGICLSASPACHLCGVREYCSYGAEGRRRA